MKILSALLGFALLAGCASLKHPVNVRRETEEIHVNRRSGLTMATVQHVADARGGKEDGEVWYVDFHKGDVRIRKSRNGSNPNHDIEVWFLDEDGSWTMR